ncbi:putative E3 ubiquitin-protein ligase UBR7 [Dendrobium catenatum]|uniref:E3 ubiquitin-protein ligase UBR7 n=1 Tax=Dendrobium catenatum TaxID=906689 RepID=A0A2I0WAE4_9ASPA|nr:putative E3 ubiquitin-protein ligase UBR7 [Dendrobium catenatum]PKU72624.1 E3 ubiquitin-protein ligase UBR7 [Dendrobium catenatum]
MAETFEDEIEQTVTIEEYIEGIEAEELEADLVLGGDEGKECTYDNGYMKRQAIFSCLTCVPSGNAGVCTACILSCHDGHEVVELWTKRKFRCDCGNSKFGEFSCKLFPNKQPENVDNAYNQNFKGRYCVCMRPYPDPETQEQVEMIQCCICEDWFHENHLGLVSTEEIPRDEEGEPLYEDFICQDCSLTCSFLKLYPSSIWAIESNKNEPVLSGKEKVLETGASAFTDLENIDNSDRVSGDYMNISNMHSKYEEMSDNKVQSQEGSSKNHKHQMNISNVHSKTEEMSDNKLQTPGETSLENYGLGEVKAFCNSLTSNVKCIIGLDLSLAAFDMEKKPMFLSKKWRDFLCRCFTCTNFYIQKGLHCLIDKEDSIEEYEKMAKQKREEKLQLEEGAEMNFLDKLNHVQKIEILRGINDLKNEFHSFLESVDTTKPITSADVQGLFENLAKKRQRLS